MDLSIIIPCFNEADSIQKLRSELFPVAESLARTATLELVFVDDGSTDNTSKLLYEAFRPVGTGTERSESHPNGSQSRAGANIVYRFVRHETNRGLGAALRSGFAAAEGQVLVTTDSDGTYHFTEIPALLAYLTPDADIVTASPYHPSGGVAGVPPYRLVLSRGSSAIYRLLVSRDVHTYTALFRAYRRSVVANIPFASDGFLGGTELLVNAMLAGYRVAEYPTVLYSRAYGVSKAKLARTIGAHLRFQAGILLRRASGQPAPLPDTQAAEGLQEGSAL
jgi:dolichol-phosphate mannosyltransferase